MTYQEKQNDVRKKTIVDYQQMQDITKRFEAEGDELTRPLMQTRQKVHDIEAEWVGKGPDYLCLVDDET